MPAFQDLTNQRFHKLVVLRQAPHRHGRTAWVCQCDCGNVLTVTGNALQRENTKSCGCLNHVKTLVDIDWNDPESRNVRRRELYAIKRDKGYIRIRTPEYYEQKRKRNKERYYEDLEASRESGRQRTKRYQEKYPEKVVASNTKFREENPNYGAEWYAEHREEQRIYNAAYNAAHPEIQRANTKRRRAQKLQAPQNDFTEAQWEEMKAAYGHRCVYCGRKMKRLTQDHITPLSKGGSHTASNIVPACRSCNSKKNNRELPCPVQPVLFLLAPPKPFKKNGTE